jgi:hypothetical protein
MMFDEICNVSTARTDTLYVRFKRPPSLKESPMIDTKVAVPALVAVLVREDQVKALRQECGRLVTSMIVLGVLAALVLLASVLV